MKKSKLQKIPLKERIEKKNTNAIYTVESELAKVDEDTVLVLNLYLNDHDTPDYRVFFLDNDYITEKIAEQERKWLTGKIHNYTSFYYTWSNDYKKRCTDWYAYLDTIEMCVRFFRTDKDLNIYDIILNQQNRIADLRLEKKRKKYTDPIDEKMKSVPDLPEDFESWVEDNVLYKSRYIYYKYEKKKQMFGYCTCCKKYVLVEGAKHGKEGICPSCGKTITYKAIGKSKHVIDEERAAIMQKSGDGFLVRYFSITKKYGSDYKNPQMSIYEDKRVFYTKDLRANSYVMGNFKNICIRWIYECDEKIAGGWYLNYYGTWRDRRTVAALYTKGLEEILADTDLRYSCIWTLSSCGKNYKFDVESFIDNIRSGNNCIEKLIKCGMYNLARDVSSRNMYSRDAIDKDGKTLNKILKVQNDDAKILIEGNPNSEVLILFRKLRQDTKKRLTAKQMQEIMKCQYNADNLYDIFKFTSPEKVLRYLASQRCREKEYIYKDYLDMCVKLNMNTKSNFVLFPKNLKSAHDMNVEIITEKQNQKTYAQHNSKYAAIKQMHSHLDAMFGFENDEYLIRPPVDAAEIVIEGQKLHHCVGGGMYSKRMIDGKSAILFIRKKKEPEKPFYTVEVDMKNYRIIQCHGFKNQDKDKNSINGFVNAWKKKVLQHLEEIDKRKVG